MVTVAASASAQVPDVVIVGETACPITCPAPFYQVEWFGPTYGHRIGDHEYKSVESAGGRLYALLPIGPGRVYVLSPDGSPTPVTTAFPAFQMHDLTVARDGAFHVLASEGAAGRILSFDPSGNLVATRNLAVTARDHHRIDLAADQCTLFYTGGAPSTIRRINVCSGAALPDLVTLPGGEIADLRVLPDGGLLVADFSRGLIRLDAAGVETRTYPLGPVNPFAIALIDNGMTALYGGDHDDAQGSLLGRLDLNSGAATTLTPTASEGLTYSIAPRLGWTAAIGAASHGGADVPTLSTWAMLVAVAGMVLLALWRM